MGCRLSRPADNAPEARASQDEEGPMSPKPALKRRATPQPGDWQGSQTSHVVPSQNDGRPTLASLAEGEEEEEAEDEAAGGRV